MDLSFGKFPGIQQKDAQNAFVLVVSFCFEDHILSLGIVGGPLLKGGHDVQEGCVYQQPRLKLHLEDELGTSNRPVDVADVFKAMLAW